MADAPTSPRSRRPKSRQSIAHVPSARTAAHKDNATTDIAALQAEHSQAQAARKKSRGKSIGPGGLEALNETTGNIAKVNTLH
jgi:kinetochore protein Spc7/SPC105